MCAFIVFAGCIATVALLLTKFKVKDDIMDIPDNTPFKYTTKASADGTTSSG